MRPALVIALAAVALVAAGCESAEIVAPTPETVVGTGAEQPATETGAPEAPAGDPAAGAEVWASAGCGSCHTLADAGSTGTVGPNLDEAKPDAARVVDRVTNGFGVMPSFKDQLSEKQIADVAAYVVQATSG